MFRRSRSVCAALTCLLLATVLVAPGQAQSDAEAARVTGALEATAEALDALVAETPRATFEIQALSDWIGDVTPLGFRVWIEQNTRLLAYRGTLKGASGAFEELAGNSLDRSLLLAALLGTKGVEARLARATLPADKAAALAALASAPAAPPFAPDASAGLAIIERLAADPRIDGARYRAFVAAETERAAAMTKKGGDMTASLVAALTPLVHLGAPPDLAGDLADHWWVQARVDGAWVDLDPVSSIIGTIAAETTMAPGEVPDNLKHRVTIRIVAEVARGGVLGATTLVERTMSAADVQGQLVSIAHRSVGQTAPADLDGTDQALLDSAAAGKLWVPTIVVDDAVTGSLVTAGGVIEEATEANIAKYGETSTFDAASDAISAMGEPEPEAGAPSDVFTAEWVEFETVTPGGATVTERRMLFDAIGATARSTGKFDGDISDTARIDRGLALQDDIDLTIITGKMSAYRATARTATLVAMGLRATASLVALPEDGEAPAVPEGYRRPGVELAEFAASRFAFSPRAGSTAITAPNIALLRAGQRVADGSLTDRRTFDIIDNRAAGAPDAVLAAGIADTVSEHLLLGAPEGSNNTAARHAADIAAGKAWAVVTPGDDAALAGVTGDRDVAALLAGDLGRGFTVIAPPGMTLADATWWRVDPASGTTLGMTTAGGAETAEYVLIVSMYIGGASCTQKGMNAKKEAGGRWFRIPRAKRASILACYGGVVIGVFFQSAAALGLIVGAAGTSLDEVK